MPPCEAWVSDGPCGKESEHPFCEDHRKRRAAVRYFKELEAIDKKEKKIELSSGIEIAADHSRIIEQYKPNTIFEKVSTVLDRVMQMEEEARIGYEPLLEKQRAGKDNAIRYKDNAGAEQLRSEVAVYERALDRSVRAIGQFAKLNIEHNATQVDSTLKKIVAQVVIRVFQRMELTPVQIEEAHKLIAEEFAKIDRVK